MKIDGGWVTHNNGANDIEVVIVGGSAADDRWRITSRRTGKTADVELDWVRPSTEPPMFQMESFRDTPAESYEGFSVLGKVSGKPNTVLVVTRCVAYTLDLAEDEVLEYPEIISTGCSNDVWYPVLCTNKATYLLTDHMKDDAVKLPPMITRAHIDARLAGGSDDDFPTPFLDFWNDSNDVDGPEVCGERYLSLWDEPLLGK